MTKPKGNVQAVEDNKPKKPRLKKNAGLNAPELEKAFVGQEVHGIVDGSFDAGYLLTVKVGDSPLVLRGLVFAPGLSIPLSKVNDIAPTIKATARDQQVVLPMSAQCATAAEESSPAATTQAPEVIKPEQEVPSVEQGRMEPDHATFASTTKNEISKANEANHSLDGQANLNDAREGNVQQPGMVGIDVQRASSNPAVKAAEAGLQRPCSDAAYTHETTSNPGA